MSRNDSEATRDALALIGQALARVPSPHTPSRIGVVGVTRAAADAETAGETAGSAAGELLASLVRGGSEVRYHDPHAAHFRDAAGRGHTGVTIDALLHWSDVIVVLVRHTDVEWDHLYANAEHIVEAAGSLSGVNAVSPDGAPK